MKRERQETVTSLVCDGCDYLLGLTAEERALGVKLAAKVTTLRVPWEPFEIEADGGYFMLFHFHGPDYESRHDCFRYWAHNTRIMERSLKERGLDADEIDRFMAVHLYRENAYKPGIERPKVKQ